MIDRGKHSVLGVLVDAVDYDYIVEDVIQAARRRVALTVSALAVHGIMTGVLDPTHRYRLNHLSRIVPDGQPVRWGLNLLHGTALNDRVYGPTLLLKICERCAKEGISIYLYGSTSTTVGALTRNLETRFPGLEVVAQPSRFRRLTKQEDAELVNEICASGAGVLFVGLGCPRQEIWLYEHQSLLSIPMLAVGAAFDFHAGILPQAPPTMQKHGLEWLYRLFHEPRRLWKRYVLLNPAFLALLLLQWMDAKLSITTQDIVSPFYAREPVSPLRYG